MADLGSILHHGEEPLPETTTPQGTQVAGVTHGHEGRDVNVRALFGWFGAVAALALFVHVVVWAGFELLMRIEADKARVPSALFRAPQVPPEPRLLPNPVDFPERPGVPLPGPQEYRVLVTRPETERLRELGLIDPETGLPRIPDAVIRQMTAAAGAPAAGGAAEPAQPMPSDASGGTAMEDRLK